MIRDTRLGLALGIATILVLGSASIAHAQYYQSPPPGYAPPPSYGAPPPRYAYPPPPPPPRYAYRSGLTVGVGIGFGGDSAQGCGTDCGIGGAFEFHIGGMLTPQLALLFDFTAFQYSIPNSNIDTYNTMYTAAVQFFPTNALWLKGGIGLARYSQSDVFTGEGFGDDSGKALLLALGYEVYQSGPFALDLQFRFADGFYNVVPNHSNAAFLVGFNWY
jgi:hypothetical protein